MAEAERRIAAYRARATASVRARLNALLDLTRLRDPRVVPFLLTVLADRTETEEVRIYVVKQLRSGTGLLVPADSGPVAKALGEVLAEKTMDELRIQAALALSDFVDIDGVLSRLGAVCLTQDESLDLRYAAFTSLERAGPTPECVAWLRQLAIDETLGGSSRSVLAAWHVP